MIYFKFNCLIPKSENKYSFLENFLDKVFSLIIPKANPDFDGKYQNVSCWYIEYDDINNYSNREIGLDEEGTVIVKGPYGKNLGFWTDTDLTLDDYKKFNIEMITIDEFEKFWEQL